MPDFSGMFFSVEELVMRADSDIQHLIDVDDPTVTRYTSTVLREGIEEKHQVYVFLFSGGRNQDFLKLRGG